MHDGIGNAKAADAIKKGLGFQVVESEVTKYYWWVDPFGYVKFDDLKIVDEKKESATNE